MSTSGPYLLPRRISCYCQDVSSINKVIGESYVGKVIVHGGIDSQRAIWYSPERRKPDPDQAIEPMSRKASKSVWTVRDKIEWSVR